MSGQNYPNTRADNFVELVIRNITKIQLESVTINNTIGSLAGVSWRLAPQNGSNDIGAARSRDAGYWPTAASPSLATIKAWNQSGVGIAWPVAKDSRYVGKEGWVWAKIGGFWAN